MSAISIGHVYAQSSVMVAGDSISAGFGEASYRLPLLNALRSYDCTVDMVGDQTLNNFDYRRPVTSSNGNNVSPFTNANGYDTDHQAFPSISASQYARGVSSSFYTVSPVQSYVGNEQPDFMLVHLGTNDLNNAITSGRMGSDAQINAWANTTVADVRLVVDRAISAHFNSSSFRILVANFIPLARDDFNASDRLRADRASRLFTQRLESMVLERGDERVLIVDVETGFDPDTMLYDGIHPNPVGEQHLAGAFLPVMRGAGLCPDTPTITSPRVGSTVNGGSTTLQWSNNGLNVGSWRVRVGDTQSGDSSTYFDSGNLSAGTTSTTVTGLPANQTNVFVSLQYTAGGNTDMVLSSFISRAGGGDTIKPTMYSPLPESALSGRTVNFTWESNDNRVRQWWVRVGSTPGQFTPNGARYFNSGRITDESTRTVSVSGLPNDGRAVFFELSANTPSGWVVQNFEYRAAGGGLPSKVLQSNQWYQISLPYNPGSSNTVSNIFGGVLPVSTYADNGNNGNWTVYRYDANANSQLQDDYTQLKLNDRLQVGKGYWIIQTLGNPVTLSARSGASENGSNVNSTQRAACENPGRCYALPVNNSVTDGKAGRFTMLGYPFANATSAKRVRVGTNGSVGCSGSRDCSLAEAYRKDLLFHTLSTWNPETEVYDSLGPLTGLLGPWDGFWTAQLPTASGRNAALIMSEPAAN